MQHIAMKNYENNKECTDKMRITTLTIAMVVL